MSSERNPNYKIPTETTLFHLDNERLRVNFPEWYERRFDGETIDGQDFNALYAATSSEIDMPYNEESVNLSFGPLIETIQKQVNPLQNSCLLEIGGASGLLARNLQDRGAKITLLETQKNFVQTAKERGIDARVYDGINLKKSLPEENKFKAVIASRVFEEVVMSEEKATIIMKQLRTILEPDGIIIIGTQRKEAVWQYAITRGTGLELISSAEFLDNKYIQHVFVCGKPRG